MGQLFGSRQNLPGTPTSKNRAAPGAARTRKEKAEMTETGAGSPWWYRPVITAVGRSGRQAGGQPELHGLGQCPAAPPTCVLSILS